VVIFLHVIFGGQYDGVVGIFDSGFVFFLYSQILDFTYILVLSHLERDKIMLIHFLTSLVCHKVSFSSLLGVQDIMSAWKIMVYSE